MSVHCIYNFQTGDFSVSLKAPGRNKHFRVHVESGMYCIGQRKFVSLQQLVDHYQVRCERNKVRTRGHHVIFSESTNLHITEGGKAFPHQAPIKIIFENIGSRFLYWGMNVLDGMNEWSWTQCSVKWQEIFDLNNQVNQANCNETRYSAVSS